MRTFIRKLTPGFIIDFYHFALAVLGCLLYGFPSRKLKVIGITGTDGKSSVVELATEVLSSAGYKVGSVSSIQFRIGDKFWPNKLKMTMPGRFKLQRLLKKMVKIGCRYAVLEVTSEGIKQYRHWGIDFDVVVLTNITEEHIESHGSFEKYRQAKGRLFRQCKGVHIINLDDKNGEYFLKFEAEEKWGYKIENGYWKMENSNRKWKMENSNFPISNFKSPLPISNFQQLISNFIEAIDIKLEPTGIRFKVKDVNFNLHLLGRFNIYNALAVICVGLSQEIDLETIKIALKKVKGIPGRMELIDEGQKFTVIVDYAHTPAALEKVYQTIQKLKVKSQKHAPYRNGVSGSGSKVICVLGAAGGGRDKWKRPILGKIAAKYCQHIILTTEDPYDEDPASIIGEIAKGIVRGKVYKIPDRRQAIKKAVNLAEGDDIVVITGKGCEPWIMVDDKKIPWDDREVVREELRKL